MFSSYSIWRPSRSKSTFFTVPLPRNHLPNLSRPARSDLLWFTLSKDLWNWKLLVVLSFLPGLYANQYRGRSASQVASWLVGLNTLPTVLVQRLIMRIHRVQALASRFSYGESNSFVTFYGDMSFGSFNLDLRVGILNILCLGGLRYHEPRLSQSGQIWRGDMKAKGTPRRLCSAILKWN